MRPDLVPAVTVEAKARARRFTIGIFGADDFHQALKTAEKRRCLCAQIHQNLIVDQRFGHMVDNDRRDRRKPVAAAAVRHESG